MSIVLVTGLPGNGKTLYTIDKVREWAKRENRPVFQSGINGLSPELGWQDIDAEKWYEAPPNSIVVIDECQRIFRPRGNGTQPPKHVSELETHRHGGIDLWLMTQHPMLADSAIRRLTQKHLHLVRIFGMQASTVHRWDTGVVENCDKNSSRKSSIKTKYVFNREVYKLYKSAEAHTITRSIPKRVFAIALIPVAIAVGVGYMWHYTQKRMHPTVDVTGKPIGAAAPVAAASSPSGGVSHVSYKNAAEDAKQYAFDHTPRAIDAAYSAPRYDEITKPTKAPVPAACVQLRDRCSCYTQQATPLNVSFATCVQIVKNGYFQDFDPNGKQQDGKLLASVAPVPVVASGHAQNAAQ